MDDWMRGDGTWTALLSLSPLQVVLVLDMSGVIELGDVRGERSGWHDDRNGRRRTENRQVDQRIIMPTHYVTPYRLGNASHACARLNSPPPPPLPRPHPTHSAGPTPACPAPASPPRAPPSCRPRSGRASARRRRSSPCPSPASP